MVSNAMESVTINQYDTVELIDDLNPKIKKGMIAVILEKYSDDGYEIEIVDTEGHNLEYEVHVLQRYLRF